MNLSRQPPKSLVALAVEGHRVEEFARVTNKPWPALASLGPAALNIAFLHFYLSMYQDSPHGFFIQRLSGFNQDHRLDSIQQDPWHRNCLTGWWLRHR